MSGSHLSKDFFELVKAIGESKSKQEEDRIVLNEVRESEVLYETMEDSMVPTIYWMTDGADFGIYTGWRLWVRSCTWPGALSVVHENKKKKQAKLIDLSKRSIAFRVPHDSLLQVQA